MKILAIDPGGTTGLALYDDNNCKPVMIGKAFWNRWSLGPDEHHWQLWEVLLVEGPFDAVVYETFNYQRRELTRGVTLRLDSVEYIGIIKLAAQRHLREVGRLVPQGPAMRTWWTDERLRTLGLWVSSPHERDATRHLLRYVTTDLGDKRFLNALKST